MYQQKKQKKTSLRFVFSTRTPILLAASFVGLAKPPFVFRVSETSDHSAAACIYSPNLVFCVPKF